jgi:2,4'-dihydroxyacetophenone dioxygenase
MSLPSSEGPFSRPGGSLDRCFAPELYLQGVLDIAAPRVWVPQAPGVSFSPILLNVTQGYYVNILRVQRSGVLSRHRHVGPVHAFTLQGSWRYLEHPWTAAPGDYVFEPPGDTHTLVVPDGTSEMMTLFHVTGGYSYLDEQGKIIGFEDVFTKLAAARVHFQASGIADEDLARLIR